MSVKKWHKYLERKMEEDYDNTRQFDFISGIVFIFLFLIILIIVYEHFKT